MFSERRKYFFIFHFLENFFHSTRELVKFQAGAKKKLAEIEILRKILGEIWRCEKFILTVHEIFTKFNTGKMSCLIMNEKTEYPFIQTERIHVFASNPNFFSCFASIADNCRRIFFFKDFCLGATDGFGRFTS